MVSEESAKKPFQYSMVMIAYLRLVLIAIIIVYLIFMLTMEITPIDKYILFFIVLVLVLLTLLTISEFFHDLKCEMVCETLIVLILGAAIILGFLIYDDILDLEQHYLLIALAGIVALIIPLILSVSGKYNIGSKLDSGEVRKSIVVSLTIIYIIFLVISFHQSLQEPSKSDGTYLAIFNVTTYGNAGDLLDRISVEINSTSSGVLQVIPVTAVANLSNGTVQITPTLPAKSGGESGGVATIPLTGDNSTGLPADAMSSFIKNFLWVYALIISFYFGSRILEERGDRNNVNDYISSLMKKDGQSLDPLYIAQVRYSMGDLGSREFEKMKCNLQEKPVIRIENVEFASGKTIDKLSFYKEISKDRMDHIKKDCAHSNIIAIMSIWNGTDKNIQIDRVFIDDSKAKILFSDKISPMSPGIVAVCLYRIGDNYGDKKIKVSTDEGIESEIIEAKISDKDIMVK